MNIFATTNDPYKAAEYLDNKRVVKMVLETCQLLCTAINVYGGVSPYKTTHKNHPCAIWVRTTRGNYEWTLKHFEGLLMEYTRRYNKVHKCESYFLHLVLEADLIPPGPFQDPPNCTTFKEVKNVYLAYNMYLHEKWQNDKVKPKWEVKNSSV